MRFRDLRVTVIHQGSEARTRLMGVESFRLVVNNFENPLVLIVFAYISMKFNKETSQVVIRKTVGTYVLQRVLCHRRELCQDSRNGDSGNSLDSWWACPIFVRLTELILEPKTPF